LTTTEQGKSIMGTTTRQKIARAIKEAWFGVDRVRDEDGLSLWTVLGGLLLSALVTAMFVIPNLLGARTATENAAPQHNLQAALPAAKVLYGTNSSSYTNITSADLDAAEPTLKFNATAPSSGPHHISFATSLSGGGGGMMMYSYETPGSYPPPSSGGGVSLPSYELMMAMRLPPPPPSPPTNTLVMAAASSTGNCYYVADVEGATSTFSGVPGSGTWYASAASPGGGCVASSPATNWQQNGFPPA
jgi:hypothetical protein